MQNRQTLITQFTQWLSKRQILVLTLLSLALMVVFMSINLQGNISYILKLRGYSLAMMVIVAFCLGISTVLFQTITNNRILTPSIMGFDSLFILIQTLLVAFIPTNLIHSFDLFTIVKFLIETSLMVFFALLLFRGLFLSNHLNLTLVLMIGIVIGTLFRGLSSLIQRLLDPNEFAILQTRMFATFTKGDPLLITCSAFVVIIVGIMLWRKRYEFDVIALGKNQSISLGIHYQKEITVTLILISILIATSTALVGPLTFLGLIVANIAYHMSRSSKHTHILPIVFLLGIIALVGGQLILQYGLNMVGALSVVIEFIGGLFFLYLIIIRFKS